MTDVTKIDIFFFKGQMDHSSALKQVITAPITGL
jgi:hypothetical protein